MKDLIEIKKLTIINIVDNETDPLSSPCVCCTGGGNGKSTNNSYDENDRMRTCCCCTYTQEIMTVMSNFSSDTTNTSTTINNNGNRKSKKSTPINFNNMCHAAHGLSLLLIAEYDEDLDDQPTSITTTKISYLLFDGGPDPNLWRQNIQKLNIELSQIDHIVLSHYHIDHSNGLRSAVSDICQAKKKKKEEQEEEEQEQEEKEEEKEKERQSQTRKNYHNNDTNQQEQSGQIIKQYKVSSSSSKLIVDLHPSQIISRGIKIRGKVHKMLPDNPTVQELQSLGGVIQLVDHEHLVGNNCFYVSGEIPRKTSFEVGMPGHFTGLPDGNWIPDEKILDERYIAVKLRGRGIIVFSACSHAGIINVCNDAISKLNSKLTAVVGGFHLAGRSMEDKIDDTVDSLKELNPDILLAGHCTGWRAKARLSQAFEYSFQPLSVGGKYVFHGMY